MGAKSHVFDEIPQRRLVRVSIATGDRIMLKIGDQVLIDGPVLPFFGDGDIELSIYRADTRS